MNYAGKVTTRKRGKTWEYRFEIEPLDGKRRWKSKGGFVRQREASAAGDKARYEYMENGERAEKANISVGAFSDIWLAHIAGKREVTTYETYQRQIENHIKPAVGKIALKELCYEDVENMLKGMRDKGLKKSTMELTKTVLSSILQYAIKPYRYIKYNVAREAEIPEATKPRQEKIPYTAEQVFEILDAVPPGHDYRMAFILGIYCGLRISECLGLTWDCIDLENRTMTIEKQLKVVTLNHKSMYAIKKPKSKCSVRTIHFSDITRKELLAEKRRQQEAAEQYGPYYTHVYAVEKEIELSGEIVTLDIAQNTCTPIVGEQDLQLVCRRENGSFFGPAVITGFSERLSKRLGYQINTHTGRHTHATLSVEQGAKLPAVAARLGQADIKVTMEYVHETDNMEIEVLECFDRALSTKDF